MGRARGGRIVNAEAVTLEPSPRGLEHHPVGLATGAGEDDPSVRVAGVESFRDCESRTEVPTGPSTCQNDGTTHSEISPPALFDSGGASCGVAISAP